MIYELLLLIVYLLFVVSFNGKIVIKYFYLMVLIDGNSGVGVLKIYKMFSIMD